MSRKFAGLLATALALLVAALGVILPSSAQSTAEVRLALVIAQTNYSGELSKIAQAQSEAKAIGDALTATGFRVTTRRDLNKEDLRRTLDDFRASLERAGANAVGFVYYTGHGVQHPQTKDSYLLGVDARLTTMSDLAAYGINMESQRDGFAATGARAVFLVFDACRNMPAIPGFKATAKGLARVDAAADMLIAFSTSIDSVAEEGVYAPVLAEEIRRPGRSAAAAFEAAQVRVAQRTARRQLPWTNNLLYNEVCFAGCGGVAGQVPQPFSPQADADTALWVEITSSDATCTDYERYRRQFPNGKYSTQAGRILSRPPCAAQPVAAPTGAGTAPAAGPTAPAQRVGEVFRDCSDCPQMVSIPAGSFMMGSPASEAGRSGDEGPQRRVTVPAFAAGKFEVTWNEYNACVSAGGCAALTSDGFGGGTRPVTNVSWDEARAYAKWLSNKTGQTYRLLSEAEWEYAARAGNAGRWSFGDSEGLLGSYAWYASNSGGKTQMVGAKAENAFGLNDMHGNVWEWVEDCYEGSYSAGQPSDGRTFTKGSCSNRVLRGGSWGGIPSFLRSADRDGSAPAGRGGNLGFRLSRTL